jgi:hypothetical protein
MDVTSETYNNLTVLTIINVGNSPIHVTTTNLLEDADHDYIYVRTPPNPYVTIDSNFKCIFIRVMFIPSVWEPSNQIPL